MADDGRQPELSDEALVDASSEIGGVFRRFQRERRPDLFLSYRRSDSSGYAGWLFDHLDSALHGRRVYMDVVSIPPGSRFAQRVRGALANAKTMLALIGPTWTESCDAQGNRRLDDPEDLVRLELQWARELGKPIVPVLIGGATLPTTDELPDALDFIAGLTPISLGDSTWSQDVDTLIARLRLPDAGRRTRGRVAGLWIGVAALVAAGVVAALLIRPAQPPSTTLGPVIPEVAPAGFFAVSTPCARFDLPVGTVYLGSGGHGGCYIDASMRPVPALHENGLPLDVAPTPPPNGDVAVAVRAYLKQTGYHWTSKQSIIVAGRPALELKGTAPGDPGVTAVAIFSDVPNGKGARSTVFWFLTGYYDDSPYYQQELQAVLASWQWVGNP